MEHSEVMLLLMMMMRWWWWWWKWCLITVPGAQMILQNVDMAINVTWQIHFQYYLDCYLAQTQCYMCYFVSGLKRRLANANSLSFGKLTANSRCSKHFHKMWMVYDGAWTHTQPCWRKFVRSKCFGFRFTFQAIQRVIEPQSWPHPVDRLVQALLGRGSDKNLTVPTTFKTFQDYQPPNIQWCCAECRWGAGAARCCSRVLWVLLVLCSFAAAAGCLCRSAVHVRKNMLQCCPRIPFAIWGLCWRNYFVTSGALLVGGIPLRTAGFA